MPIKLISVIEATEMTKYLVDTCGWVEWLTDGKLASLFKPYLKNPGRLIVPTLVQYELYKWISREKDAATALEVIGLTEQSQIEPLDTSLALSAANIAEQYKLAMADAIIYATTLKNKARLITSDQHFMLLPEVEYFKKAHEHALKN